MALTTSANFKLHDEQFQAGYSEVIRQNTEDFFNRSNGAVVMDYAALKGDYKKEAFFAQMTDVVSRRITSGTGSDAAVTPVTLSQAEHIRPRLSRKLGPIEVTLDAMRKIGASEGEISLAIGQQLAKAEAVAMLNDLVRSGVAALDQTGSVASRLSSTPTTLNRAALVAALLLMGDASTEIVCWVMHSKSYFDLVSETIDASKTPDAVASAACYGATPASLGKPVIVTDSSALVLDATVDTYYALGLTRGALAATIETQFPDLLQEMVGGKQNLTMRWQGERDWQVGVKGHAWDVTSGGANPTDEALATPDNWDQVATSIKGGAGVLLKVR
jgi:hypothetical protein